MKTNDRISNRYVIDRHIGRGGMQDVYLAKDILFGSDVALKTPQSGQHAKKFKNSAIISARINHHNVAKTFDYIVHPEQPASPPDSQCLSPGTPLQRLQDLRS